MVNNLTTVGLVLVLVLVASTAPAVVLLSEDWESGGISTGTWTTSGSGGFQPKVDNWRNSTPGGQFSLNTNGVSLGGQFDYITAVVNTVGLTQVIVEAQVIAGPRNLTEFDDHGQIAISTDNITFTTVWEVPSGHDQELHSMFVKLPPWATNQATLYVRFGMDDNNGNEKYGFDDIVISDQTPAIGKIWWEVYGDVGGGAIGNLTGAAHYPASPQVQTFLALDTATTVCEIPTDVQDSYGVRLRAYLVAPTDGDYTFWTVSDDASNLYLSTDKDPTNAVLIAQTTGWAPVRDWGRTSDVFPSSPIPLLAGTEYYFEVLMKEGGGGDNLAVGWQGPGITGDIERPIPVARFADAEISVQSVSRTLPTFYTPGTSFVVTLDMLPGMTSGPMALTEIITGAGLTVSNAVASAGTAAVVPPDRVTWDIANVGGNAAQLTYEIAVGAGVCGLLISPDGTWTGGLAGSDVVGDDLVVQASDGWQNAPIPWQDAADYGAVAAAGWTNWFACADQYLMAGSGGDVWGNNDEMQFMHLWVTGDFTIGCKALILVSVDNNTKMGLMARNTLAPDAARITTEIRGQDRDASIQYRQATGGGSNRPIDPRHPNNDDAILVMTRKDVAPAPRFAFWIDTLEGGGLTKMILTRNVPGAPVDEMSSPITNLITGSAAVGLYIVSHNDGQLAIGQFNDVFISSSTSLLDVDAGISISRTLPTSGYTPGGAALGVVLTASTPTLAGITVVTSETVPVDMTISNIVASAGAAVVVGNTIVWTMTSTAAEETLTYDATPTGAACNDQIWSGVYDGGAVTFLGLDAGSLATVGGDTGVAQLPGAGDIWQNAPIAWDNALDIGPVGAAGNTDWFACDDRYEILASGADVWGGADQFQFIYYTVPGEFSIDTTISYPEPPPLSFPPVNHWTKAGVMVRDNLSDGSPNMTMGIAWRDGRRHFIPQWRDDQGGGTGNDESGPDALPSGGSVNLSRGAGTIVTAGYDDLAGNSDASFATRDMTNIRGAALVGLWVTSHQNPDLSLGRFEDVVLSTTKDRTTALGAETVVRDLPTTSYNPSAVIPVTLDATAFWFTVSAPTTVTETVPAALTIQNATASLGSIATLGNVITWVIPNLSTTATLTYDAVVPAGACGETYVWSGSFDNGVDINPVTGVDTAGAMNDNGWQNSLASWFGSDDIGCAGFPGDTLWFTCDDSYQITGGGRDIWDRNDGMHFLWMQVAGDFEIAVDAEWLGSPPDFWSKAGIFARNTLDKASEDVGCMIRRDGNFHTQRRTLFQRWTDGGSESGPTQTTPKRIFMKREATTFTLGYDALTSPVNRNLAVQAWDAPEIRGVVYLGLGVTGHSTNGPATVRFSNLATTLTQYAATLGAVTRTFATEVPGEYQWGEPTTVTITALAPGPAAASLQLVEMLPPGAVVTDITNAGGAVTPTLNANSIVWDTTLGWGPPGGAVSYTIVPARDLMFPALCQLGGYAQDSNGFRVNTQGVVFHQGIAHFQSGVHPDVNYEGTDDVHVTINGSNNSMGSWDSLEEGDWGGGTGDHKKILLGFDTSAYPAGRVANAVAVGTGTLNLYHWGYRRGGEGTNWTAADHPVYAALILKAWDEGCGWGADGPTAMPGEVTWTSVAHGQTTWERTGVMGLTDVADATTNETVFAHQFGWYSWNLSADLATILDPAFNGYKMSQDPNRDVDDNTNTYVAGPYDFYSSEYLDDHTLRPLLTIKDEEPTPVEVSTFMLY